MKYWPLANSNELQIPAKNEPGAFWQDTGEGFNAGIDLFAPSGSDVLAIDSGIIAGIGDFTVIKEGTGFHKTKFVIIRTKEKINYKYCQLKNVLFEVGDSVKGGEKIAETTSMINEDDISHDTSFYVKELSTLDIESRLHLELYKVPFSEIRPYNAGIYLGEEKPKSLLDPKIFMQGLMKPVESER